MYVPCGNFIFLNEQKVKSKTFPAEELKTVVDALKAALEDAEFSKRVKSHEMDNYMEIAESNGLFYPGSYPDTEEEEVEPFMGSLDQMGAVSTMLRRLTLIER